LRHETLIRLSAAAALLALNLWICWRLLFLEYLPHFVSLEPFFFVLATAIRSNWLHPGWWRQWFCGMPFTYTYQPLFHYMVAAVSAVTGLSVPRAFHAVLAVGYALGPVSVFALILRLSRRMDVSFTASLLYSLWSPGPLLIPALKVDLGGVWYANRLQTSVVYADSPYMFGLTLLPIAILLLDRVLEKQTPTRWIGASLGIISVVLTNIPATISLAMALVAYGLAAERGERGRRWTAMAAASAVGYLLAASLLPPSGLSRNLSNSQLMDSAGRFDSRHLIEICIVAGALIAVAWTLRRLRQPPFARFAILFALFSMSVALGNRWFNVSLLPEAGRFHPVMEMAIVMALSSLVVPFVTKWRPGRIGFAVAMTVFCFVQVGHYRSFARRIIYAADIGARSETKIARWMEEHAHGARVFVPGSVSFWLNALTDTPQMIGCCDQNVLFQAPRIAYSAINYDKTPDASIAWLRALGVHFVAMCGPRSTEHFRALQYPNKFDGVLPLLWRDGDDAIFEVPARSNSLAHAIAADQLIQSDPVDASGFAALQRYVEAIESSVHPEAAFIWESTERARIQGVVRRGEVVSVQIAYNSGWVADAGGRSIRVSQDAMGFMAIDPQCDGDCSIVLKFTGGTEAAVLRALTALAWTIALFAMLVAKRTAARTHP
jgi:hypothetical protein